jgi:hypothetical protein
MLLSTISVRQQSVVRYLVPLVTDFSNQQSQRLAGSRATGHHNNFTPVRHLSHSAFTMSSSKFQLANKYKGLEKNVWYVDMFSNSLNCICYSESFLDLTQTIIFHSGLNS